MGLRIMINVLAIVFSNAILGQIKVKFNFELDFPIKDSIVNVEIFDSNGGYVDSTLFLNSNYTYITKPDVEYKFNFWLGSGRKTYPVNGIRVLRKQLKDTSITIKFIRINNYNEEFKLDTIFYSKNSNGIAMDYANYLCPLITDNVFNQVTIEYHYSEAKKAKVALERCLNVSRLIVKNCNYNSNNIDFEYVLKTSNCAKDFLIIKLHRRR